MRHLVAFWFVVNSLMVCLFILTPPPEESLAQAPLDASFWQRVEAEKVALAQRPPRTKAEIEKAEAEAALWNARAERISAEMDAAWANLPGNPDKAKEFHERVRDLFRMIVCKKYDDAERKRLGTPLGLSDAQRKQLQPRIWSAVFAAQTAERAQEEKYARRAADAVIFLRQWELEIQDSDLHELDKGKLLDRIPPLLKEGMALVYKPPAK